VLEVNAQCGLSEDENYTSIGAILRYADCGFASLVQELISRAVVERPASRPLVSS
jgi:D-alanine-D-alanine ligase